MVTKIFSLIFFLVELSMPTQFNAHDHVDSSSLIPSCAEVCRIQLFRTTLVRLLDFDQHIVNDFCSGCFVRVLIELTDGSAGDAAQRPRSTNDYHCAVLRGVRRLDPYDGFTWDNTTTDLHFDIELPCRSPSQPNFVQLNSISNSPIQETEYTQWVYQMRQSNAHICTPSQIDLRLSVLTQHTRTYLRAHDAKTKRQKGRALGDKASASRIATAKADILDRLRACHNEFPLSSTVDSLGKEDLCNLEGELQRELERVRHVIHDKEKCVVCRAAACEVICYPCRHQVVCALCSKGMTICPVPQCGMQVLDIIEPFGG